MTASQPKSTPSHHLSTYTTPSIKRRLICMVYESLLLFGVIFFFGIVFDIATQSKHALMMRHAREAYLFVIIGAYFIYFWRKNGQTLAMQTWRIKVVNIHGGRLNFLQALVRYCLAWLFFVPGLYLAYAMQLKGALMLIPVIGGFVGWVLFCHFTPNKQFLHDFFAKTQLIELPKSIIENAQ